MRDAVHSDADDGIRSIGEGEGLPADGKRAGHLNGSLILALGKTADMARKRAFHAGNLQRNIGLRAGGHRIAEAQERRERHRRVAAELASHHLQPCARGRIPRRLDIADPFAVYAAVGHQLFGDFRVARSGYGRFHEDGHVFRRTDFDDLQPFHQPCSLRKN